MVMDKLVEMNYKKLWEELMTICGKKFWRCVILTMMVRFHSRNLLNSWLKNINDMIKNKYVVKWHLHLSTSFIHNDGLSICWLCIDLLCNYTKFYSLCYEILRFILFEWDRRFHKCNATYWSCYCCTSIW